MSLLPPVVGVIERRLLVNYRVDPEVAARLLPEPFRPHLVHGHAVAGLCLLRMGGLRVAPVPSRLGAHSESVAHRFAVEWDTPDGVATGVWIRRRDTDSRLTVLVGGRVYPGVHHRARFTVVESPDRVQVACTSLDGATDVRVDVDVVDQLVGSKLFADVDEASKFFERASVGWSPARRPGCTEGLTLETTGWRVEAGAVHHAHSSFFEDRSLFPPGSAVLDGALVMRRVPAVWRPVPESRQPVRARVA